MSRINCDFNPHFSDLYKAYNEFTKDKNVTKNIMDPDEAFYNLIQSEFKMPLEVLKFNQKLSKGDIKGFKDRLQNIKEAAESGILSGKMASLFYTPEAFARKDPMIGKLLDGYIHTSHYYKGNETKHKEMQYKINAALDEEMIARGFRRDSLSKIGKKITKSDALTQARKYREDKIKLHLKAENTGDIEAQKQYRLIEQREEALIVDSELQVYGEFIGFIENGLPQLINKKLENSKKKFPNEPKKWLKWDVKRKDPFLSKDELNELVDAEGNLISPAMRNALYEYTVLTNDLYNTLSSGMQAYIDNVKLGQSNQSKENLDRLGTLLEEKLMPNFEKGYFPHFSTDLNVDFMDGLMGRMEDMVLASNKYFNTSMTLDQAVKNMEGYVSGHTKSRAKQGPESMKYSLDFPAVIAQYSQNVDRFNYINTINKNTKDVISHLEKMYKTGKDSRGYGESVLEFIHDLHRSATGYNEIKNPVVNNMMRTILGLEFISKIGFNPRSAVRNMSQALLNYVHWDNTARRQAADFYRDPVKDAEVTLQMESLGILFSEARELEESIGNNPNGFTTVQYNKTTKKLEHVPISASEKILNAVSGVASKSGKWMAKAENVNRKWTYKIAYSQMYKSLENPNFDKMVKDRYLASHKEEPKKGWANLIEQKRANYAKNYAVNMTVALHFDYSKFSKSKVMREGGGQLVFQFQQYSFKIFERTKEYWDKAKNDLLADKKMTTENQWRLYKLGLIYGLAPTFASAMTGLDFTGLIELDPLARLQDTATAIVGDEEDKKKVFHGSGPIRGNIGIPHLSTWINLGHMFNVINVDDDSMLSYLGGLQDHYDISGDPSLYNMVRLGNAFFGRLGFRHLPQLAEGNLGWVAQSELGMNPSSRWQEKQKELKKMKLSKSIYDSLDYLQKQGR
tara:strand:- start:1845 stop:4571 length:2727 start_codon:yes stop_codon:yes gene_type:complete